jgi:hypothetical protein
MFPGRRVPPVTVEIIGERTDRMSTPDYPLLTVPGYELYQLAHLTTFVVDALARHRRAAEARDQPDRRAAAAVETPTGCGTGPGCRWVSPGSGLRASTSSAMAVQMRVLWAAAYRGVAVRSSAIQASRSRRPLRSGTPA